MTRAYHWLALAVLISACDTETEAQRSGRDLEQWNGRCRDEAIVLGTMPGIHDFYRCPSKLHRMRVQLIPSSSDGEFGAVVFCECARDGAKP